MIEVPVKVKALDEEIRKFGLPKYAYKGDAGADLYCILDPDHRDDGLTIYPGERAVINTGLAISIGQGYWARIVHRSSAEKKHRIRVIEGTIDNEYTGPLKVHVQNPHTYPINIKHGDRLAQLIILPICQGQFEWADHLPLSDRGTKGFGSSGN